MGVRSLLHSAESKVMDSSRELWFFYIWAIIACVSILLFCGWKFIEHQMSRYYAEPISEKVISKFSHCEMRRAEQRIATLKRPLIRSDLEDLENDCDKEKEALRQEKEKVRQAEILTKQKALLKARSND